uniref:CDK5 regulatory subunit associated protein 3 n=1 Tax=Crocodylus porosus TaxID=8502 RepID=A0A7M4EJC5_CROPO
MSIVRSFRLTGETLQWSRCQFWMQLIMASPLKMERRLRRLTGASHWSLPPRELLAMGSTGAVGIARRCRSQCWRLGPRLETFLSQRIVEMSEEADVLSVSQFQLAPPILQGQTREKVADSLSVIQDLIGRLTNLRMQHLFMILASPRYVDRVSDLLRQKLKQADLLVLKKEFMVQKREEALAEQGALEPRLDLLVQKTKELQKLIEADISKRYSGRPVNLMGMSL